ncbi:hypothetical protein HDU97_006174 [Phlyctochytrium planicorne]|nr:hypothetical protein HDU97_006174 [Phlyctochytrium planicorne]
MAAKPALSVLPRPHLRIILFPLRIPRHTVLPPPAITKDPYRYRPVIVDQPPAVSSLVLPPLQQKSQFWYLHVSPASAAILDKGENDSNKWKAYVRKWSLWVSQQWDGMAHLKEGTFGKRVHTVGVKVLDTIDSEEYFLKSVPELPKDAPKPILTLHYPADTPILSTPSIKPLNLLTHVASSRTAYHRRWYFLSILCLPISAAATILPGPNFFFLYNLVRLYDHYRAMKGGQALENWIRGSESERALVRVRVDERLDGIMDRVGAVDEAMGPAIADEGIVIEDSVVQEVGNAVLEGDKEDLDGFISDGVVVASGGVDAAKEGEKALLQPFEVAMVRARKQMLRYERMLKEGKTFLWPWE